MSRIAFHRYHAKVFQLRTKGCQGFDHDQLNIVCQEFVNDMLADSAVPTDDEMSSQLIYPLLHAFSPKKAAELPGHNEISQRTERIRRSADSQDYQCPGEYAANRREWTYFAESNCADRDDGHVNAVSPRPTLDHHVSHRAKPKQEDIERRNDYDLTIKFPACNCQVRFPPGTGLPSGVSDAVRAKHMNRGAKVVGARVQKSDSRDGPIEGVP